MFNETNVQTKQCSTKQCSTKQCSTKLRSTNFRSTKQCFHERQRTAWSSTGIQGASRPQKLAPDQSTAKERSYLVEVAFWCETSS